MRTRVKVCGITREPDAVSAAQLDVLLSRLGGAAASAIRASTASGIAMNGMRVSGRTKHA